MVKRPPTIEEITAVVEASATDDAVLVGGMAVSMLARIYDQTSDEPIYTRDGDFFGDRLAMGKAKEGLPWQTREYVASMDDATPNSGKLAVDVAADAEPVEIDFLYRIDGLSSDEIEQKAVALKMANGKILRVLHPLLAMENKVNNLAMYPAKRTAGGIGQARMVIRIAQTYLSRIADEREQLNAMERVGRFAGREGACFAYKAFGVDVLAAIPDSPQSETFRTLRLPQLQGHIAERRQAFEKVWDRIAETRDPVKQRFRP